MQPPLTSGELPGSYTIRTYRRRELVFAPESHTEEIYLVRKGKIRLFMTDASGRECTISVLVPGDMFSGHTRCGGEAVSEVEVAVTDRRSFVQMMMHDPEVCYRLLSVLGRCLNNAFDLIEAMAFKACSSRLAWMLLTEARAQGEPCGAGIRLPVDLTTEQIASRIGATRQTVSTLLNEWERSGLISRGKGEWLIRDPARLEWISTAGGDGKRMHRRNKQMERGLKIAISGKGGVGKTTLAATLACLFAQDGQRVLAVDADADANLGEALGFTAEELAAQRTIAEDRDLIKARTGATPGVQGQWFTLNPRVDDIPDTYVIEKEGIRLLRLGHKLRGGAGCDCPENAFLKELLRHLVVERTDTVIVDMEAGLEHMGRGTTDSVNALIVVVEPGRRSFQTAEMIAQFARDLGVERVFAVANKVRPGDEAAVEEGIPSLPLLGMLPYDPSATQVDLAGASVRQLSPDFWEAARRVQERLKELV